MPQVFGCPNCQNPFQVPDDAAGQTFQCPSCQSAIEVPASESQPPPILETQKVEVHTESEIFQCPHCAGQFGIEPSMYGENLTCPHCENVVAIGESAAEESTAGPEIMIESDRPDVSDADDIDWQTSSQPSESEGGTSSGVVESPHTDTSVPSSVFTEEKGGDGETEGDAEAVEEAEPTNEPVFEPQPVDHLLPPRFTVPDPVRFPARRGSSEVILPDGEGGYQAVDANVVTITHKGEVYHLKRLSPEQRRRRRNIHNTIAIGIAVVLIYLTLKTLGVLS